MLIAGQTVDQRQRAEKLKQRRLDAKDERLRKIKQRKLGIQPDDTIGAHITPRR